MPFVLTVFELSLPELSLSEPLLSKWLLLELELANVALDILVALEILSLILSLLELLLDILLLMAELESLFKLKSSSPAVEDSPVSISDSVFISKDITSNPSVSGEANPTKVAEL